MSRLLVSSLACFSLALGACGAPPAPPATPTADAPAASASPTAPAAKTEPEKPTEPAKPAEAEKPAAKALPASKTTINGVSISTVTEKDIAPLIEKAGWKVQVGGLQPPQKFGRNETFSVVGYKGAKLDKSAKSVFYFGFARKAAVSDPTNAASEDQFEPKKLKDMYVGSNPKLLYVYDESADVLVTVNAMSKDMQPAQLQKIFDDMVVKPK